MSMNLRHAAALALVGWYLMIPPASELPTFDKGNVGILDLFRHRHVYDAKTTTLEQAMSLMMLGDEEPVFSSTWVTMFSFETLDACESHMGNIVNAFHDIKDKKLSELSPTVYRPAMRFAAANCIATDDPRLKETK